MFKIKKSNINNSVLDYICGIEPPGSISHGVSLDYIRYKQLNWYVHVQRLNKERLPRKILKWCLPRRTRKGRPRNSWMQEVTTEMRSDMEWVDREEWRRKIKL